MKAQHSLAFTAYLPIRWRDLDAFGHVNNADYFTYFEQARAMWWNSLGLALTNLQTGPVVVTAECTYLKPIVFPANLIIKLFVSPPGNSSYMIFYEVYTATKEEVLYAHGSTKIVWVDYQLGKAIPLPDKMKNHLPLVLPINSNPC